MGLFDSLKGALESEALPALLNTVLAQTQYHDLNGLVAALEKGGLGTVLSSAGRASLSSAPLRLSNKFIVTLPHG